MSYILQTYIEKVNKKNSILFTIKNQLISN